MLRTHLFRAFATVRHRQLAAIPPAMQQEETLSRLLRRAQNTRFGRDHNFASLTSVDDFQRAVPLRPYEDMWRDYFSQEFPHLTDVSWPGRVPYFALSSGTSSGTTKYIPCTEAMLKSNRQAALDLLAHHLRWCPHSRVLEGKCFILGGSTDLREEAPGVRSGDLSGITAATVPWWAKSSYFPPPELALLANWSEKMERLAEAALKVDIRMISGVPSWLLVFFERMAAVAQHDEVRLRLLFPNLELVVLGGVRLAPYIGRFRDLLRGSTAEIREVYPASEGFIASADADEESGLLLNTSHGLFFEFVPITELNAASPIVHWLDSIELDIDYALVLTTCSGLWRYVIGDTVRFTSSIPPRLVVTGRTSYFLSAFGEHLTGEEIELAVARAGQTVGLTLSEFSVIPVYPRGDKALGYHAFYVESGSEITPSAAGHELAAALAAAIDEDLTRLNEDYAAHRGGGVGMDPPTVYLLAPGAFTSWMAARGKLGGQNKVPRVINQESLAQHLAASMTDFCVGCSKLKAAPDRAQFEAETAHH